MPNPAWLDRSAYPFESHFLNLPAGRMHYVDEGHGAPVLMLHGNPTWSFAYRHLVRHLAPHYRCVAPDYLGFGLSDKPSGWSYHPRDHAEAIDQLMTTLDLNDVTLVVHDWGGPIGLACALRRPERIRRIVLMNTWMWPVDDDWRFLLFSRFFGGPLGRMLIRRFNLFARLILPLGFGRPTRLTRSVYRHYTAPPGRPGEREGNWVFAREVASAAGWLDALWSQRDTLADKPALILWGMRDLAFRQKELDRWQTLWPQARVERLATVGHFVQEELGAALGPRVESFLRESA